jgi:ribosome recycling factor
LQKNGLSEDVALDGEKQIQDLTNKFIALIDKHLEAKEKEIMSV